MNCPKCGHPQTCPCTSCQSRTPTEKPWIHLNGEEIQCGGCGFVKNANWWMDYEHWGYEKYKFRESLTGNRGT